MSKKLKKKTGKPKAEEKDKNENEDEMSDDSEPDMPIFTPELAKLKKKEMGEEDEDMELDDDVDDVGNKAMNDDLPSQYSDSSDEKEDYTIRNSDSLIVAATAENDHSSLEVYLYDHKSSDLYVHHEILLGSYPLCLEWLSMWQQTKTNHIIVGTFLPEIEIWNLDSEAVEPAALLGSLEKSEAFKAG